MLTPSQQIQSYYLALFGRAADPEGLSYWQSQLETGSTDLGDMLKYMLLSEEFEAQQRALGQANETDVINEVYQRLFAREVESEGSDYWLEQANSGASLQVLLEAIIASASATDQEALKAYTAIADFYSHNVSTDGYDAEQSLVQDGFRSNEALYADLEALDERFATLSLTQAGESLEGRPLYAASVGDGPRKLMIATQQHGDEPTGTEAAMHLLEWLSGDSDMAQALRDEVTVMVMPRVNPDGFQRWEQLAAGELDPETTIDPRRNSADIDLNRTWDSEEELDASQIPEQVAVRAIIDAFAPDMLLDYHNQNNYLSEADELETMSMLWATNDSVDPAVTATAQQAALALAEGIETLDYGHLSLFPGGDTPQIARNGLSLDGVPTLLIEQRGLEELSLKALEGLELDFDAVASAVTLQGLLGMLGVIDGLADDAFSGFDPELASLIPERGERASYDQLYSEAAAPTATAAIAQSASSDIPIMGVAESNMGDDFVEIA